VQIEKMPRNTHGKIDRASLPAVTVDKEAIVKPRTPMEEKVSRIVAETLKAAPGSFGVLTDLMYVGLHSLLAASVMTEIHHEFGVDLPVAEILGHPTVEHIAFLVEQGDAKEAPGEATPLDANDGLYPLTDTQMGYYGGWLYDRSIIADVPMLYRFDTDVDADRLAGAVRLAVDAHPILKAHIELKGDVPHWRGNDDAVVDIPVADMGEAELDAFKDAFLHSDDLLEGPLCYGQVCRTEEAVYLFFAVHHIIYDGFSRRVLTEDILSAYDGKAPLAREYVGFEAGLREKERRGGDAWRQAKAYYDEKLSGFQGPTLLIGQKQATPGQGKAKISHVFVERKAVDDFCAANALTGNDVFLTALAAAAAKLSGENRVYFKTEILGRDTASTMNAMGLFVRNKPLAIDVDTRLSAMELYKAVQDETYHMLKHGAYTLQDAETEHGFDAAFNYLFQAGGIFEFHHQLEGKPVADLSNELMNKLMAGSAPFFPCDVQVFSVAHPETGAGLYAVNARFDDADFTDGLISDFLGAMKSFIETGIRRPDAKVDEALAGAPTEAR
jgi:acyl carrier protein